MNGWAWETDDKVRLIPSGVVKDIDEDEGKALISFDNGQARIEGFGESIVRMTLTGGSFLNLKSQAVIRAFDEKAVWVERNEKQILIKCGGLNLKLEENSAGLTLYRDGTELFALNQAFYRGQTDLCLRAHLSESSKLFGLGEKTGFLDKKGRKYTMWNTDDFLHTPDKDPLYKSIPFLIHMDGERTFGLFLDSTARSEFDLGFNIRNQMEIRVYDEEMDLYFISGKTVADIVMQYTWLTGKMELPPAWSLGYQQCRWSYFPQERIFDIAETFRKKDIPCDVIYLDIDYMNEFRVFTWNSNRFPDPANMCKMLDQMGFKLVTIVDPGVKKDSDYEVYMEGVKNGHFCKLPTGEVYHGKVWPGISAYPDFSSSEARKWWGEKHAKLFYSGVRGIWNDMNEPSDFLPEAGSDRTLATVPNDVMLDYDGNPRSFAKGHNAYGLNMCKATVEGFETLLPEERSFIVTRSAYAGIQRYAAVWTGDNHSWWEHLASSIPMHLNIGLSGVPFVGGDVGGFQGECSPELFARWIQLGAFTPFFRAHSSIHTKDHEPWAFGEEVESIAREAIKLRYSLMPYLYSQIKKACDTGLPVMRPLLLDYAEDINTHTINDEFMFGDSILVAPVLKPQERKRMVYLPSGIWYDFHTKQAIEGGQHIIVEAPLNRIPLFIRAGAIIPVANPAPSIRLMDTSLIQLQVYAGDNGNFELYEDDGLTKSYRQGVFNVTSFSQMADQHSGLSFRVECKQKGYDNGFKKATVLVYGLPSGLCVEQGSRQDGVYRFEITNGDGEVKIG